MGGAGQETCHSQGPINLANYLSDTLYTKFHQIPWPEIIALRNMVIHEYFGIDIQIIWKIIRKNITELKVQVLLILGELES